MIRNNKIMLLFMVALLIMILSINSLAVTKKLPKTLNIVSINNITTTITKGSHFILPKTVKAKMSNNTFSNIAVKWSPSKIDTNVVGIIKLYGTVLKFNKKIILNLTITEPIAINWIEDIKISIHQNQKYELPLTVLACMSDGFEKKVLISWNKKNIDTSKIGESEITGIVNGYNNIVKLTVLIVPNKLTILLNDVVQIRSWGKDMGESGTGVILDKDTRIKVIQWINNANIVEGANLSSGMKPPLSEITVYFSDNKTLSIFIFDNSLIIGSYKAVQNDLYEYLKTISLGSN